MVSAQYVRMALCNQKDYLSTIAFTTNFKIKIKLIKFDVHRCFNASVWRQKESFFLSNVIHENEYMINNEKIVKEPDSVS